MKGGTTMSRMRKGLVLAASLPFLLMADFAPQAPFGFTPVREALAVIGAPLTPMSYAGVARRTTRRAVVMTESTVAAEQQAATAQQQAATAQQQAATAQQQAATAQQQQAMAARPAGAPPVGAIVSALPEGCVSAPRDGIEYYNCEGVFYRSAFQGNNLVYVVQ